MDILNHVSSHSQNNRHLCVFDELFSGTNPYEAVASAIAYIEYLNKKSNVQFILTTHYIDLCEYFEKEKTSVNNYTLEQKYLLKTGISRIRGGIKVLEDLQFPDEILKTAKKRVSLN